MAKQLYVGTLSFHVCQEGVCAYLVTRIRLCFCVFVQAFICGMRAVDNLDNPLYSHSYFCRFSMCVLSGGGGGGGWRGTTPSDSNKYDTDIEAQMKFIYTYQSQERF